MALANEAGLSWDGIDLSAAPILLRVVSPQTFEMPTPRVFYSDLAAGDGGVAFSATKGPLRPSYECKLAAANEAARKIAITALIAALSSHTDGVKQLIRGWDPDNYWLANLTSALSPETMITGASFTLSFLVPNPVKVAIT